MSRTILAVFAAAIVGLAFAWFEHGSDARPASFGILAYEEDGSIKIVEVLQNTDGSVKLNPISETPHEASHAAWAPDGNSLAYVSQQNGSTGIYSMNPDGSGKALLLEDQPGARDLTWSPDGTKIVFSSDIGGNLQLYLFNLEDSDVVRLTSPPGASYGASWSPNGDKLTYTRVADSIPNVTIVNFRGSVAAGEDLFCDFPVAEPKCPVIDDPGLHPSWSPKADRISYVSLMQEGQSQGESESSQPEQISTFDIYSGKRRRITNNEFRNVDPNWTTDGNKLVFSSRRLDSSNEWWQLYIVDSDGANEIQITTGEKHSVRPVWSPISFANQGWTPKVSSNPVGPGPNIYSADNVFFDQHGYLHLRITQSDGEWSSAEIVSDQSYGYGIYSFRLGKVLGGLPKGVVLGLFTWDEFDEPSHREVDIEFGVNRDPTLTFTVHPGGPKRFPLYPDSGVVYSFDWRPDRVTFETRNSSGDLTHNHTVFENIPAPRKRKSQDEPLATRR